MLEDATLELTLIELISSRICHDLVGPVGAVNAGAELMGEDGVGDDEALALMRKSGLEAARRPTAVSFGLWPGRKQCRYRGNARSRCPDLCRRRESDA